ncbi:hypothetical protein BDA99DRAFT_527823 [Phascolomyces articulosus]|uniref:Uncharacterized protein n=1 Tax=Phascolomyces articulosus TaxID=60185 RepID=A0AAD5P972_9FUNG|nr:hypothetical protein BDA99DRAFT_527823 [Phascolomyces articulosus]
MKSKQENSYRDLFFDLPNFINNNTENGLPCQSNTIIPSNFIGSDLNKDDQSYNYHSINTFLPLQQQQQQQQSEFYFQYNHNNQATTDIIYEPDYPFGGNASLYF